MSDIVLVSGHWPLNISFPINTKKTIDYYCSLHNYDFYYDEQQPTEIELHHLHFRRCDILKRASHKFPNGKWFVWLDTDIFVNRMNTTIESVIDLSDTNILYHFFYETEKNKFSVNTGVKFVSKEGINIESEIWNLRNDDLWKKFPYEQKVINEKIIPQYSDRIIIHEPHILNCLDRLYPIEDGLFVHLCARTNEYRNKIMDLLMEKGLNDKILVKRFTLSGRTKIHN
jgi:hypothetical protein